MKAEKTGENTCKGLIFRGNNSVFATENGRIEQRQFFSLLKRKSCPGCPICGDSLKHVIEMFNDQCLDSIHSEPIQHGVLYKALICEDNVCFEEIKG